MWKNDGSKHSSLDRSLDKNYIERHSSISNGKYNKIYDISKYSVFIH